MDEYWLGSKQTFIVSLFIQEFECMTFKYPYSYSNQIHNPLNQIPKISLIFFIVVLVLLNAVFTSAWSVT